MRCRPFLGLGLLMACWMFVLAAVGQSSSQRKSTTPPARYSAEGAIPMPEDRAEDSYAIYSLLMPGPTLASLPAEQGAPWAIGAVTVNDNDREPRVPPQGQLKPPPDNPKGFGEAVEDYEVNKYTRVQLKKEEFHLDHAFTLLDPEAANSHSYPGITYFSEVYFDAKHKAALVYMNEWCANLCSAGTWVYLEKHGGQWVRRSGVVAPGA